MKKIRKVFTVLLLVLSTFILVSCDEDPIVRPETSDVNKLSLQNDLITAKNLMSNVIRDENILIKYKGFNYLSAAIFDEVTNNIRDIEIEFATSDLSQEQVFELSRNLRNIQINIVSNIKTSPTDGLLSPDLTKIAEVFDFDYTKYPNDWNDYYFNYVEVEKEKLKLSLSLDEDLVTSLNKVSKLISFMDKELLGQNQYDETNEIYFNRNPFPSSQPKFINLPNPTVAFVLYKGNPQNLLAGVQATDAKGDDISSQVYFIQNQNIFEPNIYYAQIAVKDDYGNETIAPGFYQITVTSEPSAPSIRVRQEKEIVSLTRASTTDIRSYVDLVDYLGFTMPLSNVDILYIYDDKGGIYDADHGYVYENQTIPSNNFEIREFDNFEELDILNDVKYINARLKEVILPYLTEGEVTWELEENDYISLSTKIENGDVRTTIRCNDLPLTDEFVTLTATKNGQTKSFRIKILSQVKEEIQMISSVGTYKIGYKGFDNEGNYSLSVEKELIILPPSSQTVSDLVEATNILPQYKNFNISDLDELLASVNNEEFKYYLKGSYPLQERTKIANDKGYDINEDAQVIIFDEAIQFIDERYKLDGFHQMSYDLMPYIDGFVPIGGQSNIIIPNQNLINMFHKNGVKVYGYLSVPFSYEGGSVADIEKLIEKDLEGNYKYLDIFSDLAKSFGFDGWAITIRTNLYDYRPNTDTMTQADLLRYEENRALAQKRMEEEIIPFMNAFYAHLKDEELTSIYQAGLADDGAVHITSIYSDDHKAMGEGADLFVTGSNDKRPSTLAEEYQAFKETNRSPEQFFKGMWAAYPDNLQFSLDDFLYLLEREILIGKIENVAPKLNIELNETFEYSEPIVYQKYNLGDELLLNQDYIITILGDVDTSQEGKYKLVYRFTNRYDDSDVVDVEQIVVVGDPDLSAEIISISKTTSYSSIRLPMPTDGKGSGKLLTSIAIYNLSWNVFNIKTHNANYNRLDPKSPFNLVGANDYSEYQMRMSKFIGNQLDFDPLAELIANQTTIENHRDYFYLSRLVNPKTVINSSAFYTRFNSVSSYYYFIDGEMNQDFTNRSTWNSDSGLNNQPAQDIVPTYHWLTTLNNQSSESHKLNVGYYFEDAYQGFNSLRFEGQMNQDSNQRITLYATNIDLSKSQNSVAKVAIKIANATKTKVFLVINNQSILLDVSASNEWQEIEISIPTEIEVVNKIGFEITTDQTTNYFADVRVGELFIGDKSAIKNETFVINNLVINELGFKYNIYADALISFDYLPKDAKYQVFQKDQNGIWHYLTESYENHIVVGDIKRYASEPNKRFPSLEEFDETAQLKVVAIDNLGNQLGEKQFSFDWPQELIPGGKAEVRLSSTIALPGDPIIFTPILSPMTEHYFFEFGPGAVANPIPGTNQWVATWEKEGFYDFKYWTTNPYGEDVLDLKQVIIISEDVPSESDLTPDAFIDDSDEMADIKYSRGIANADERPRYLIDEGPDGGANLYTKWCNTNKNPGQRWVIIDFAEPVTINRFVLSHAASSLSNSWDQNTMHNTIEYEIFVSEDGINWTKVVHRENNSRTITEDILETPVRAKHIKLNIVNGGDDISARVYDMRIFGTR